MKGAQRLSKALRNPLGCVLSFQVENYLLPSKEVAVKFLDHLKEIQNATKRGGGLPHM